MKPPYRIAFVNQPIDRVLPPLSSSLGLWTYHVARMLAETAEVHILGGVPALRGRSARHGQVHYHLVPLRIGDALRRRCARLALLDRPGRPRFASLLYYLDYGTQTARALRRLRPDVIHVLNFSQFVPLLRRLNPSSRIVLHMQCEWLNQMDAGLVGRNIASVSGLIGCSHYITDTAARAFPHVAPRARTVHNGVDPTVFSPAPRSAGATGESGLEILFVGRVSPEKGVHDLLQAFSAIARTHPKVRLKVIGGVAPGLTDFIAKVPTHDPLEREIARRYRAGYRDTLQSLIPAEVAPRVSFVHDTPNCQLMDCYRNADVFVFPSAWNEPFGIPIIEAMACGKPVVATRSGGIPEIVEHGKTGLLVERGQPEALRTAITRLLDDPGLRAAMGRAGRERAQAYFSWEHICRELLQAYRDFPAPAHLSAHLSNNTPTPTIASRNHGNQPP